MGGSTPAVDDAAVSWLLAAAHPERPSTSDAGVPAPRSPPDGFVGAGAPVDALRDAREDRVTAAMRRAVALSAAGGEATHPNPNVGAVVLDAAGEIVGEGR